MDPKTSRDTAQNICGNHLKFDIEYNEEFYTFNDAKRKVFICPPEICLVRVTLLNTTEHWMMNTFTITLLLISVKKVSHIKECDNKKSFTRFWGYVIKCLLLYWQKSITTDFPVCVSVARSSYQHWRLIDIWHLIKGQLIHLLQPRLVHRHTLGLYKPSGQDAGRLEKFNLFFQVVFNSLQYMIWIKWD